jgi:hypothetical protein
MIIMIRSNSFWAHKKQAYITDVVALVVRLQIAGKCHLPQLLCWLLPN